MAHLAAAARRSRSATCAINLINFVLLNDEPQARLLDDPRLALQTRQFGGGVKAISENVVNATVSIYNKISESLADALKSYYTSTCATCPRSSGASRSRPPT